ncbi:ribonuclease H-like domain-containing protein [Phyllosticta citribraziliensis]|uniref:ribonuclease H n=1 Tax=Phyllosticta citribraziliensis TaxID=989973 RepID=A0ABR1LGK2_9PEZI
MTAPAKDRRLQLPPNLGKLDYDKIIRECFDCGRLYFDYGEILFQKPMLFHNLAVVITDGACLRNGQSASRAGIGIVAGSDPSQQFSIPWHRIDCIPAGLERTSQRAEIFAAMEGLRKAVDVHAHLSWATLEWLRPSKLILATDSEYVVNGLTEWFPNWKKHGNKTSRGVRSVNFDLFEQLEATVIELEKNHRMEIFFLNVPHEAKARADRLAGDAARLDDATVEANTVRLAQFHI